MKTTFLSAILLVLTSFSGWTQEDFKTSVDITRDTVTFSWKITNNCDVDYYVPTYAHLYGDILYNSDSSTVFIILKKKNLFNDLRNNIVNDGSVEKKHKKLVRKLFELEITFMGNSDNESITRTKHCIFITVKKKSTTKIFLKAKIEEMKIAAFKTRNIGMCLAVVTKKTKDTLNKVYISPMYLDVIASDPIKKPYSGNTLPEPGNSWNYKVMYFKDGQLVLDKTMTQMSEGQFKQFDGCLSKEIDKSKKTH